MVSVITGLIFVEAVRKRRRRWMLGVGGHMSLMLSHPMRPMEGDGRIGDVEKMGTMSVTFR